MPRTRHNRSRTNEKSSNGNHGDNTSTSSSAKSAQGISATSGKRSTIPELVILTHGSPNNLLEFRRKLSVYALRVFKDPELNRFR